VRKGLFALVLGGSLACGQESGERLPETRRDPHPAPKPTVLPTAAPVRLDAQVLRAASGLLCLTPESLTAFPGGIQFGEGGVDSTTGDIGGLFFRFSFADSGILGLALEATGEVGKPQPFTDLQLDPRDGAISFAYGESNRSRFNGWFSCDRLWGRWEPYPRHVEEETVFRRMT
jgi:hypothetical protein